MDNHTDHFYLVLLGLLAGIVFMGIAVVAIAMYLDNKEKDKAKEDNPWKFEMQKPHTDLFSGSFTWEGPHQSFKDFKDSEGRHRRCYFIVNFFYEAECTAENIGSVLTLEKEHKITNSKESDIVVGRTVWSMIKKRIIDTAGSDFFKDEELHGELALLEEINPFDRLAPELKISKSSSISVSYYIAKVV